MEMPTWVKPTLLGAVVGAGAAMIVGFSWGGWMTGGAAGRLATDSAQAAVVQTFTPLCVVRAEQAPDQRAQLMAQSNWSRRNFVIEAGWVDNVNERYRSAVATECAAVVVEAMD